MTKNIPMLRKVMETIEARESEWDQSFYRNVHPCGTTYCFAGFTCELDPDTEWATEFSTSEVVRSGGYVMPVAERAMRILGLTKSEAIEIFLDFTGHDVGELREVVERVAGERL